MNALEDKVRRRLAPFIAEGKIGAPQFSSASGPLTVAVRLKSAKSRTDNVELALQNAMRDLEADARLVISPV